ncbi:TPA: hypothetical protein I8034_002966 [Legionella pneumophila]|nr:P-loop NTPase fold protein [Legionella pneumophila subsp. fraseri]HAT1773589.1 hypothetical protein [Legionella pneumophila]MDX1847810.1 P-loop NTPase fold protein [Legionella pneumophila subsp. fraseri]HAT2128383.1 hypothetical protein [Legionella pneumophila]HAT2137453.1 hypothetical protein [Legionella pneumophila]
MSKNEITFETRDEFDRKPIAKKLITMIESNLAISPMVIDGNWGTGKTEFCTKTLHLIKTEHQDSLTCAYIDAFEADHTNDPLIPIVAAISDLIEDSSKKIAFLNKAKAVEEGSENIVNGIIQDYQEAKKDIDSLKTILKDITKDKKLVIFIDELDRCRPDFAIAIIEKIKQVFDIENVKFILVTNYSQMMAAVNHCYGQALDAHRYLDKFIKFKFYLTQSKYSNKRKQHVSYHYAEQLIKNSDVLKGHSSYYLDSRHDLLNSLISINELSLREISNFILYLELFHTLKSDQLPSNIWYHFTIFIVFILYFKPVLRDKIIKREVLASELCKLIGIDSHVRAKKLTHDISGVSRDIATLIIFYLNDTSVPVYKADDEEDFKGWLQKLGLSNDIGYTEFKNFLEKFITDICNEFQFVTNIKRH